MTPLLDAMRLKLKNVSYYGIEAPMEIYKITEKSEKSLEIDTSKIQNQMR